MTPHPLISNSQIIPDSATALWYCAPGTAQLAETALKAPEAEEILVRTCFSAISRGTERLVFAGEVASSEYQTMRAPFQEGEFSYPVKYGYSAVGRVEHGPSALLGRLVFALHPHQTAFVVPATMAHLVPEGVSAARATLAANMETALNILWDAGAGPGDRITIIGGGAVGLLVAYLAARLPGADVTLIDPDISRAPVAAAFGARFQSKADMQDEKSDIVIHATGTAQGLADSLACCGFEATLTEASWYGQKPVTISLGGAFHAGRIKLISSQVGSVAASRRPRWTHARRIAKALILLENPVLDMLLSRTVAFSDLPATLSEILAPGAPGIVPLISYP